MRRGTMRYTKHDIVNALHDVGVTQGDALFIHSNIGFLGRLEDAHDPASFYAIFKQALIQVVGQEGTIVVPTFSYSFCKKQEFNKDHTPGVCGFLSEAVRQDPEALRSDDANFSVAALGRLADYFTKQMPEYSFGKDSFWERFLKQGGKFCNINFDAGSTFIHYVERELAVPYRFDKPFQGVAVTGVTREHKTFYHFCYDLAQTEHAPYFERFDRYVKDHTIARTANLARGQVVMIGAQDTFDAIAQGLAQDPFFLTQKTKVEKGA